MSRRVLIRDRVRNLFLSWEGQWTRDAATARDFDTTLFAVTVCMREKLTGADVVVKITGRPDVVVPVDTTAEHPGSAGTD